LVLSTAPLYAQGQQNVGRLKMDARNLVGVIDDSDKPVGRAMVSVD
jgi:hypothetical protein